jgi:hypothetical protein
VRAALAAGDFDATRALLGHPYSMSGHVIHGAKLGRTLGFPTLNLRVAHRPALAGIFVVQVHGLADQPLPAVASLGVRPTVEDAAACCSKCTSSTGPALLRQAGARRIPAKLRDEEKYVDLPTLTAAIDRDAARHAPGSPNRLQHRSDGPRGAHRHRPNLTDEPAPRFQRRPAHVTTTAFHLEKPMSDTKKVQTAPAPSSAQARQQIPGQHDRHPVPDARRPRQARAGLGQAMAGQEDL